MDHWVMMFLKGLQDSDIKVWAFMKYVDDVNIVVDIVAEGWRWVNGNLEWEEHWQDKDRMSGDTGEVCFPRSELLA